MSCGKSIEGVRDDRLIKLGRLYMDLLMRRAMSQGLKIFYGAMIAIGLLSLAMIVIGEMGTVFGYGS